MGNDRWQFENRWQINNILWNTNDISSAFMLVYLINISLYN